ncbi:hypothetical protein [Streptomyces sp. Tu102]|uniref:hypothetical protein n=1 Tax=Streptomyces sp. Tu102 TaxID=2838019 RepID=UPI001BDD636D|nr:hypothetical protein [Streptomyces sp. Tu102]MBT1097839.1 hypothetical protein [Streptomyces sp. Tu102]
MTVSTTTPRDTRRPSFWYGLPVGYISMDLNPPAEQLLEVINQLRGLPDGPREEADRALRLYAGIVNQLNTNRVQACALGMHPNDAGGYTTSVFTVSTLPTSGNPKLVVAGLAGSASDGKDEGTRPLELPSGLGYLSEKRLPAPRSSRRPELNDTLPSHIWQGIVAVAAPSTPELIVLQMVTPDLDAADDYRNILLGISRTLTFTDPERATADGSSAQGSEAPTGAAALMRNDFG